MNCEVRRVEYKDVEGLRELYRHDAHCQIIHDSALRRAIADPYLMLVGGRIAGYGGVWNQYYPGRLMEFYLLPFVRDRATMLARELLAVSGATQIEAQTNQPDMLTLLYDCAVNIVEEKVLFEDASVTRLAAPAGQFRRATPDDGIGGEIPVDWVIEAESAIVASGGYLCHYNPPYGDVFMEVAEGARQQGFGSYFVQEVKRVCYENGKRPAARCNPDNVASRRTLTKAGFRPCGRLLVGDVRTDL